MRIRGGSNIKLKGNITNKKLDKIFFPLVAIIILFLGSICTITDATANGNATKIEITYPPDKAVIGMHAGVRGNAPNISDEKKLWIVVCDGSHYFPQKNVSFGNNTSEWCADDIILGGQNNGGLYYRIDAVLANETANSTLTNDSKDETLKADGIPFLPKGAESVDYVVVERVRYPTFWEEKKEYLCALVGVCGTLFGALIGALVCALVGNLGAKDPKYKILVFLLVVLAILLVILLVILFYLLLKN